MNDHNHDNEIEILRKYDEAQAKAMRGEFTDEVVLSCAGCIQVVQKRGQKRLADAVGKNLIGRNVFVKAHFYDAAGSSENMWIQVTGYKNKQQKVAGRLASAPRIIEGLSAGDKVTVDFKEVIDVLIDEDVH